jgi:acyl carrier protein
VAPLPHSENIWSRATLRGGLLGLVGYVSESGALVMTIPLRSTQPLPAVEERSTATHVRTLIANHLGVDVERVTNEAHFIQDLGADWLDRLELMIVIEDQFAGLEIADDEIDRIETVGDLIHHIESFMNGAKTS